ncbi:MAG TPA: tetratricopeptide repeat protein [Kofleriaceae bacterium]|nr:tetratricopeptide repeat protein [Kofleriaceae bacterium]
MNVAVLAEVLAAQEVEEVLGLHGSGTVARGAVAVLVGLILLLGGCARPRPAGPSAATRAEVTAAEAALQRRDYDAARAAYGRAIATAPDPASEAFARRELASMLVLIQELDAAARELEAVTRLAPRDPRAWHDLGIVRHARDDVAGAITALGEARALAPRDPRPRIALAALYWKTGDRAAALAEYRALLDLDLPDRVRAKVEWAIGELSRP